MNQSLLILLKEAKEAGTTGNYSGGQEVLHVFIAPNNDHHVK